MENKDSSSALDKDPNHSEGDDSDRDFGAQQKANGFVRTESIYRAHYKIARYNDRMRLDSLENKDDDVVHIQDSSLSRQ